MRWWRRLVGRSRRPEVDVGVLGSDPAGGTGWTVRAKVLELPSGLVVVELRLEPGGDRPVDEAWVRLPARDLERVLETLADVSRRVEIGSDDDPPPGTRLASRLLGPPGAELVWPWEGVAATQEGAGERIDLYLMRDPDGDPVLFFVAGSQSHGTWPPEVASLVVASRDRLRAAVAACR